MGIMGPMGLIGLSVPSVPYATFRAIGNTRKTMKPTNLQYRDFY